MATALNIPLERLDPDERRFVEAVRQYGWFQTSVMGDDEGPGFSYTTGFWSSAGMPDLIVFGLGKDTAHKLLWNLYRLVEAGRVFAPSVRTSDLFVDLPAYIFPVDASHYPAYLGWSRWFYRGDAFPCHQIVWPDRSHRFPWDCGFDASYAGDQIDLTEFGWAASLAS